MAIPILATKLYVPPPRPNVVSRPRLIERLSYSLQPSQCSGRNLILISAPAGFGKTTLVSEWAAGCKQPVAWLSLDEGDSDLTRFLTYLIAALQTLAGNIGEGVLSVLQSPQTPPTESILTTLINEIATIPDNFVLVLDDYHLIDSKPVDEALNFLLKHLPLQMHLVITTREDPHLPLARLRARGQLTELRAADLRFTPTEAADFLNQVMGLNLSEEDIAALEARTEGWIAGLQMAALSMQGHQDAKSLIRSFTGSHHFVLDYLLEEVLHQQSKSIQTFLLRTSILDRLCGPLCDAVLGSPSASGQETLEYLEHTNLFIAQLDSERHWYRYHHLFGDLLRQRLGKPKEFAELHLRASHWHEENGDLGAAFHHAIAAGDFVRAAEMAEAAWQGMDDTFQLATWLGWVKKMPEEVIRFRPVLCTLLGRAFADAGEPEASESRLQDAERCLNGLDLVNEAQLKSLPVLIALTRAYNAQVQGDLAATVKYAEQALRIIPEDDFMMRAQALITLEVTHWTSGELEPAIQALGDWMNSMEKVGNFVFVVASAFAVADILVVQGRLREAIKTYQQYIKLASKHGEDAQHITAHHYLGLALLQHEMGEDIAAEENLQKAREVGELTTLVDWPYRWHVAQARLKESGGDLEDALGQLDAARRVYVKTPVPDTRPIDALKAKVYLKQGRLALAQDWAYKRELSVDDEISYLSEFEHLTLVRVLMAENQNHQGSGSFLQVMGLLERLLNAAEAQRRTGSVIEILVVQALAYQVQGNLPLALASLERGLLLAQPEGYVRIFVDEGQPMRSLLLEFRPAPAVRQASRIEKHSNGQNHSLLVYVEKLLAGFERAVEKQPTTNPKKPDMVEPLSERELEVLRLIAMGLTNLQISQRLVLALSTIKGHNLRIFAKLQAQNRSEAVKHARELGLL
ncbi:MAG: helix-turn-helix transcriptional regulator [Chloroflexi bacterium HGW-Chloroflexi-10]|nr:MAG: helix-turn-helix transcriptional regulator [Chloroflexi bacterium HGW-Chloroflexi-10]